MTPGSDLEPAWSTLHNAHLQRRRVRFSRGGVEVTGQVIGFDARGGIEHVTVEAYGGLEINFIIAGSKAEFVG